MDHGIKFSFKEVGLVVDAAYCCTLLFIFVDCSHKSTLKVKRVSLFQTNCALCVFLLYFTFTTTTVDYTVGYSSFKIIVNIIISSVTS